eukprot:TRINITY_DN6878_c0_g1_i1.p1 TRINITY_DN6878_c0_g1~~TRINITY_DN6878_c0_g1_i1.p1  ORF type:complete len:958 (-),score=157.48 TRINITY_DN6878_c0_g1_i1:59-2668(-)
MVEMTKLLNFVSEQNSLVYFVFLLDSLKDFDSHEVLQAREFFDDYKHNIFLNKLRNITDYIDSIPITVVCDIEKKDSNNIIIPNPVNRKEKVDVTKTFHNFSDYFDQDYLFDISFTFPTGECIKAHRIIIFSKSKKLKDVYEYEISSVLICKYSYKAFHFFIKFLYNPQRDINENMDDAIEDLGKIGEDFDMEVLSDMSKKYQRGLEFIDKIKKTQTPINLAKELIPILKTQFNSDTICDAVTSITINAVTSIIDYVLLFLENASNLNNYHLAELQLLIFTGTSSISEDLLSLHSEITTFWINLSWDQQMELVVKVRSLLYPIMGDLAHLTSRLRSQSSELKKYVIGYTVLGETIDIVKDLLMASEKYIRKEPEFKDRSIVKGANNFVKKLEENDMKEYLIFFREGYFKYMENVNYIIDVGVLLIKSLNDNPVIIDIVNSGFDTMGDNFDHLLEMTQNEKLELKLRELQHSFQAFDKERLRFPLIQSGFFEELFTDFNIHTDSHIIQTHKILLIQHSTYFKELLAVNPQMSSTYIEEEEISSVIKHMYTCDVDKYEGAVNGVDNVIKIAKKYEFAAVEDSLRKWMRKNLPAYSLQNSQLYSVDTWLETFKYLSFLDIEMLRLSCHTFLLMIESHPEIFLNLHVEESYPQFGFFISKEIFPDLPVNEKIAFFRRLARCFAYEDYRFCSSIQIPKNKFQKYLSISKEKMNAGNKYQININCFGKKGSGRRSLISRFMNPEETPKKNNFHQGQRLLQVNNSTVELSLSITSSEYFPKPEVRCVDLSQQHLDQIIEMSGLASGTMLIAGTKSDMRAANFDEVLGEIKNTFKTKVIYIETSALQNINVEALFIIATTIHIWKEKYYCPLTSGIF